MKESATAKLLPPEFYMFNYTNIDPWKIVDSLCIMKVLTFHLSWNWG